MLFTPARPARTGRTHAPLQIAGQCPTVGAIVNFAADLDGLIRIVKRKLKKIQYRPHLIDGWLTGSGLTIEPW